MADSKDITTFKLALLGIFVMQALIVWNQFRLTDNEERFTNQITCFVKESFAQNDPAHPETSPAGPGILKVCGFVK